MKKNKKKHNSRISLVLLVTIIVSVLFYLHFAIAENSISSILNGGEADLNTRDKIDELNHRAEIYRQIIDIKKQQQETLSNQLSVMDSNIDQVAAEIDAKKQQIVDLGSQISKLEAQIIEKDKAIDLQKGMLVNLMQVYYQTTQTSIAAIYLSQSNIAAYITNKDRLGQTSDSISKLVNLLNDLRRDLSEQNNSLNQKKGDLVDAHDELQTKNDTLESTKQQKQDLLIQTKGEEIQYQQLLARVKQQKQELLDIDQFFASSGLSIDSYPKPDSSLFASTEWFYSQKDSRWGDMTIGNTKTLMKSYGCAVASIAMIFKQHKGTDTPATLAKKSIFSGDLINWPTSWSSPKLALISSKAHSGVDWSIIDGQIAKGNPVIVYIKKTNGGGGHYVVIHHKDAKTGKYVVHDPYFGSNIFLDTTRALVGAMGSNSSTLIDQMIIYN